MQPSTSDTPAAVMSVDVEDWFQVENLRGAISRADWETQERRVERNTERVLEVFAATDTYATFFCLGWIAERHPELIKRIADAGHEIAGHGYAHRLIYEQSPELFRADVRHAKDLLEEITGEEVLGYRAPSFSITEDALHILAETGHRYDSSWFPSPGHERYGHLQISEEGSVIRLTDPEIIELPLSVLRVGARPVPWGGGGWFRLYPAALFRWGFARSLRARNGGMFYIHPWELDPGQPRVSGIPRGYAFRHYVNLSKTEERLRALCKTVPFTRADRFLGLR
jgi:polysaccharide deacetylase family protein (PEP-CTERM system associated)